MGLILVTFAFLHLISKFLLNLVTCRKNSYWLCTYNQNWYSTTKVIPLVPLGQMMNFFFASGLLRAPHSTSLYCRRLCRVSLRIFEHFRLDFIQFLFNCIEKCKGFEILEILLNLDIFEEPFCCFNLVSRHHNFKVHRIFA